MLGTALSRLRQPRYAALAALMLVVALVCIAAGTWQIARFKQSVRENGALKGNARRAAVALSTSLVPLTGHGRAPGPYAIRYRTVTVTGTYLGDGQQFVRLHSDDGASEFQVLTPLRTAEGVLLVVRGTVSNAAHTTPPAGVTAPPTGTVHLTGRLQTAQSATDDAASLGHRMVSSINPTEQTSRLAAPVYAAYLALDPHQPGTAGVKVTPAPDLSNPAGGAYEWQHFAYIIQWYAFALLALAAPFAMRRHEVREARRRFLGIDPDASEFDLAAGPAPRQLAGSAPGEGRLDGQLEVRRPGDLVAAADAASAHWQRATKLADRYGRSLDMDEDEAAAQVSSARRFQPVSEVGWDDTVTDSASVPHRSVDAHHGAYNDYLWQLALADGAAPAGGPQGSDRRAGDEPGADGPAPDEATRRRSGEVYEPGDDATP